MRTLGIVVLTAVAMGGGPARVAANGDVDAKAAAVIAEVRQALGGDGRVSGVRTIVASGQQQRSVGQQQFGGDFELWVALPDRYLLAQHDQTPFGMTISRETGFAGDQLLTRVSGPPGGGGNVRVFTAGPGGARPGEPPTPEQQARMEAAQLRNARADLARLALGWFAMAPDARSFSFRHAGEAESPDGRADVIHVAGPEGFEARLFVDQQSRLPLMLAWEGPASRMRVITAAPGGRAPEDVARQAMEDAGPPALVEHRMYFADHRKVNGILVPFQITRSIDGQTSEVLTFDKVRINADIKASTFARK